MGACSSIVRPHARALPCACASARDVPCARAAGPSHLQATVDRGAGGGSAAHPAAPAGAADPLAAAEAVAAAALRARHAALQVRRARPHGGYAFAHTPRMAICIRVFATHIIPPAIATHADVHSRMRSRTCLCRATAGHGLRSDGAGVRAARAHVRGPAPEGRPLKLARVRVRAGPAFMAALACCENAILCGGARSEAPYGASDALEALLAAWHAHLCVWCLCWLIVSGTKIDVRRRVNRTCMNVCSSGVRSHSCVVAGETVRPLRVRADHGSSKIRYT